MPDPLIAALVLAAGSSIRFGTNNKLLADINGTRLIESVFSNLMGCGLDRVLVVVAPDQPEIETLVQAAGFSSVVNPNAEAGMGSSIACGMQWILQNRAETLSGVAIYLGDMPSIGSDTSRRLLEEFKRGDCHQIVRPTYSADQKTTPGHPVFFPSDFFPMLASLTGDTGAKRLIEQNPPRLTEVNIMETGVIRDIDRPLDL